MNLILKDYIIPLLIILAGLSILIIKKDYIQHDIENTQHIQGVLNEDPKFKVSEDEDCIKLWIKGYHDRFKFSGCSYNERIKAQMHLLHKGDSIDLYVKTKRSSRTFDWHGESYSTFKICNAWSRKTGDIISFSQFNSCDKFYSTKVLPFLSGLIIFIGIVQVFRKRKNNILNRSRKNINQEIRLDLNNSSWSGKPNKISFLTRKLYWTLMLVGLGVLVFYNYSDKYPLHIIIALSLLLVGSGRLFLINKNQEKTNYYISIKGIQIIDANVFLKKEYFEIDYRNIKEVYCKTIYN
jgi:hypothetical protein